MNASDMWFEAYNLQYKGGKGSHDKAEALYRELIKTYPSTDEAGFAKRQLEILGRGSEVVPQVKTASGYKQSAAEAPKISINDLDPSTSSYCKVFEIVQLYDMVRKAKTLEAVEFIMKDVSKKLRELPTLTKQEDEFMDSFMDNIGESFDNHSIASNTIEYKINNCVDKVGGADNASLLVGSAFVIVVMLIFIGLVSILQPILAIPGAFIGLIILARLMR